MKRTLPLFFLFVAGASPYGLSQVTSLDTVYTPSGYPEGNLTATIFLPDPSVARGVGVILAHGMGESRSGNDWCDTLAARGYVAMTIDYVDINQPGGLFPKPVRAVKTAVQFLRRNAEQFGITTGKIVAWGRSQGSLVWGQAMTMGTDHEYFGTDSTVSDRVDAAVLLYGLYDMTGPMPSWVNDVLATYFSSDPALRTTRGQTIANTVNIDVPVLLLHATSDLFLYVQHSRALHDSLKAQRKVSSLIEFNSSGFANDVRKHVFDMTAGNDFTDLGLQAKDSVLAFLNSIFPKNKSTAGEWMSATGTEGRRIRALAVGQNGWIFAATDSGMYYSADDGMSWSRRGVSTDNFLGVASHPGGDLYAIEASTIDESSLVASSDQGESWTGMASIPVYGGCVWGREWVNHAMVIVPNGDIYVDGRRSVNDGSSFEYLGLGILGSMAFDENGNIFGAGWCDEPSTVRSSDGGVSWTQLNALDTIVALGVNSSGFSLVAGRRDGSISMSTDAGETWNELYTVGSSPIAIAVRSSGDVFVCTSDSGIYRNGEQVNGGLSGFRVNCIILTPSGGLLVGTESGVFKYIGPTSTSVDRHEIERPIDFLLLQNYPNPFNPITRIRFVSPLTSHVSLKIFDLLGREVQTLVDEKLSPGSYEGTWDASGFPSGTYFYRLQVGELVETRKLILLR